MTGITLPWNDEAEKRILNILLSPSADSFALMDKLKLEEHITGKDFYGSMNRKIFETVEKLCEDGKEVDIVTIANAMNCATSETAMTALKSIISPLTVTSSLTYYAKILSELSQRRNYITMAQRVINLASDTSQVLDTINTEIEKATTADDEHLKMKCAKDELESVYGEIVDRFSNPKKLAGIPTEWDSINKRTGGLGKGEFIIIGGRPGMGKSIAGQNIAEHVAFHENKKALVFTMEMPMRQYCKRIVASRSSISYSKFKSGDVIDDDFLKLGLTMEKPGFENLMITDTTHINIGEIKALCRAEKRRCKEIGVVVIDYIGLMQLPQRNKSRWEGISEISRELKLLAKELDCPIVALCQLNRVLEHEKEKRPALSDLRDSGSLEQDADMVILLYRDEYYHPETKDKGIIEMNLAKVRDGKPGVVKLAWQPHVMRIMEQKELARLTKQAEELKRKKYGEQTNMEVQK